MAQTSNKTSREIDGSDGEYLSCYQCEEEVDYLFADGRCENCTQEELC